MPAPEPLISVIIVCRNPGPKLRVAFASVLGQRKADFELVVIDGASDDGTKEWLETQRSTLGTLVSEPDQGIYDAMNKGIAAARGRWVLFLGADDSLKDEHVLANATVCLNKSATLVGVAEIRYSDGRIYRLQTPAQAVRRNFLHHQGAFFRRTLFNQHGKFDSTFRVQADYDFNLRLLLAGVDFRALPLMIATCGPNGMSDSGDWTNYREEIEIRHRHFPGYQCWLWDIGSVVRYLRKKIIRRQNPNG